MCMKGKEQNEGKKIVLKTACLLFAWGKCAFGLYGRRLYCIRAILIIFFQQEYTQNTLLFCFSFVLLGFIPFSLPLCRYFSFHFVRFPPFFGSCKYLRKRPIHIRTLAAEYVLYVPLWPSRKRNLCVCDLFAASSIRFMFCDIFRQCTHINATDKQVSPANGIGFPQKNQCSTGICLTTLRRSMVVLITIIRIL